MIRLTRNVKDTHGVPKEAIANFVSALSTGDFKQEVHRFMLLRHGEVIAEGYADPYKKTIKHHLYSLSKSFTSTAIGFAVSEGLLSIEDSVLDYAGDWLTPESQKGYEKVTLKDLLSMSVGQEYDFFSKEGAFDYKRWPELFFKVPLIHDPGSVFHYNNGATYLLSAILTKVTGQKVETYLKPRLFEPLGFGPYKWLSCPQKNNTGAFGFYIQLEDQAKFGQCLLDKGKWQGKQVIPEAWVELATSKIVDNNPNGDEAADWNQGYGFQFWRCTHGAFRGDGAFGQYCVVIPEYDMVLATHAGWGDMGQITKAFWDHVYPYIDQVGEGLPIGKSLPYAFPSGPNKNLWPLECERIESCGGKQKNLPYSEYELEKPYGYLTRIGIQTDGKGQGMLHWIESNRYYEIPFHTHTYEVGRVPYMFNKEKTCAQGGWVSEGKIEIMVRLVETPHAAKVSLLPQGDRLDVIIQPNVSFETSETAELIGKKVE